MPRLPVAGNLSSPMEEPGGRLVITRGAYLPHWRKGGATYAVTFRLADSLPAQTLRRWTGHRERIVRRAAQMGRPLTAIECRRLDELYSERVERWLDRGHGSCVLRDERIARLVRDALQFFDGERYDLVAWVIMPNHVHVVLQMRAGHDLSKTLLSWKGFTGKKAREILESRGEGAFWQKESYDHLVRGREDLTHQVRYVLENPERAGLRDWPWVWHRPSGR